MVVAPQERLLVGLHARPFVHDVVAKVEVLGNVDFKVLEEVLVAVKFDARTVLA